MDIRESVTRNLGVPGALTDLLPCENSLQSNWFSNERRVSCLLLSGEFRHDRLKRRVISLFRLLAEARGLITERRSERCAMFERKGDCIANHVGQRPVLVLTLSARLKQ